MSPKQRAHYLNLKARSYQAQTGRVCDPVTERDWAELDGVL